MRMHSSGMHTACLFTVPQHALWQGVYLPGGCTCLRGVPALGVYLPRVVPTWGVYLPRECTCLGGVPAQVLPSPCEQND